MRSACCAVSAGLAVGDLGERRQARAGTGAVEVEREVERRARAGEVLVELRGRCVEHGSVTRGDALHRRDQRGRAGRRARSQPAGLRHQRRIVSVPTGTVVSWLRRVVSCKMKRNERPRAGRSIRVIGDDAPMLFMIIEHFEGGDPAPAYRRFAEPADGAAGLEYHGSWVTDDLTRCYQVMECANPALLEVIQRVGRSRPVRGDRGDLVRRRGRCGGGAQVANRDLLSASGTGLYGDPKGLFQSLAVVLLRLSAERAGGAQEKTILTVLGLAVGVSLVIAVSSLSRARRRPGESAGTRSPASAPTSPVTLAPQTQDASQGGGPGGRRLRRARARGDQGQSVGDHGPLEARQAGATSSSTTSSCPARSSRSHRTPRPRSRRSTASHRLRAASCSPPSTSPGPSRRSSQRSRRAASRSRSTGRSPRPTAAEFTAMQKCLQKAGITVGAGQGGRASTPPRGRYRPSRWSRWRRWRQDRWW